MCVHAGFSCYFINVRYDTCNKITVNFFFQVKWSIYFSIICKGYNANRWLFDIMNSIPHDGIYGDWMSIVFTFHAFTQGFLHCIVWGYNTVLLPFVTIVTAHDLYFTFLAAKRGKVWYFNDNSSKKNTNFKIQHQHNTINSFHCSSLQACTVSLKGKTCYMFLKKTEKRNIVLGVWIKLLLINTSHVQLKKKRYCIKCLRNAFWLKFMFNFQCTFQLCIDNPTNQDFYS